MTLLAPVRRIEVAAGLLVAVRPRLGGYAVAAWLAGVVADLLLVPGFYDVVLRDVGLVVAAVALAQLAAAYPGRHHPRPGTTRPAA